MGKMITAKIDVLKIKKELLFTGQRGTYLDLTIWINDKPDQFGNDISIEQRTKKGEDKIYLGNGKFYVKPDAVPDKQGEWQGKQSVKSMSDVNELPGTDNPDNLPF